MDNEWKMADRLRSNAVFLRGMAAASTSSDPDVRQRLRESSMALERLADNTCAQGYVGCEGGSTCTSDHK